MALGNSTLDSRTDLYGLGCVACWLMTGNLIFEEKTATAMMLAHLPNVPVAPSKRIEREVPACLDHAIMTCLAKAPAQRPADADVFARLLERCEEVGAWTPRDAEHWWHTNMAADVVRANDSAPPLHGHSDLLTTL